jgi:hypothetical protein
MRLVTVTPEVTMKDVEFMMKRVGVTEAEIDDVMGEKDWVLSVRPSKNFTVAMITTKEFPTALGVSKRNPIDSEKVETGARIALRRCLEEAKSLKSGVTEGVVGLG